MTRWPSLRLTAVLTMLAVATGCSAPRVGSNLKPLGLDYQLRALKSPRPNRAHVLRVDLANGRTQPAVVLAHDPDASGPAEAVLTDPLRLAGDSSVLAFINTNPWDSFCDSSGKRNRGWYPGQPVDILGLAVSGGHRRSPPNDGDASIWVDTHGRLSLGKPPAQPSVVEGMSGFQQIVAAGDVIAVPGGPLHPRTCIGVDRTGTIGWLVVVDGRQPHYSEGMTLYELGELMRDLGCWDATNMDGGGSSLMGLANAKGKLRVVNHPSDRGPNGRTKIRPLPAILTIRSTSPASSSPARGDAPSEP